MDETISAADATRITAYLNIEASLAMATAHIFIGTNQPIPAELVARRITKD